MSQQEDMIDTGLKDETLTNATNTNNTNNRKEEEDTVHLITSSVDENQIIVTEKCTTEIISMTGEEEPLSKEEETMNPSKESHSVQNVPSDDDDDDDEFGDFEDFQEESSCTITIDKEHVPSSNDTTATTTTSTTTTKTKTLNAFLSNVSSVFHKVFQMQSNVCPLNELQQTQQHVNMDCDDTIGSLEETMQTHRIHHFQGTSTTTEEHNTQCMSPLYHAQHLFDHTSSRRIPSNVYLDHRRNLPIHDLDDATFHFNGYGLQQESWNEFSSRAFHHEDSVSKGHTTTVPLFSLPPDSIHHPMSNTTTTPMTTASSTTTTTTTTTTTKVRKEPASWIETKHTLLTPTIVNVPPPKNTNASSIAQHEKSTHDVVNVTNNEDTSVTTSNAVIETDVFSMFDHSFAFETNHIVDHDNRNDAVSHIPLGIQLQERHEMKETTTTTNSSSTTMDNVHSPSSWNKWIPEIKEQEGDCKEQCNQEEPNVILDDDDDDDDDDWNDFHEPVSNQEQDLDQQDQNENNNDWNDFQEPVSNQEQDLDRQDNDENNNDWKHLSGHHHAFTPMAPNPEENENNGPFESIPFDRNFEDTSTTDPQKTFETKDVSTEEKIGEDMNGEFIETQPLDVFHVHVPTESPDSSSALVMDHSSSSLHDVTLSIQSNFNHTNQVQREDEDDEDIMSNVGGVMETKSSAITDAFSDLLS